MLQGLFARDPLGGIDAHEGADKVLGLVADPGPAVRVEPVSAPHDHLEQCSLSRSENSEVIPLHQGILIVLEPGRPKRGQI